MSRRGAVLGALVLLLTAACGSPERLSGSVGPAGVGPASSSHSPAPSPTPTNQFKNLDYGPTEGNTSGTDLTFRVPEAWKLLISDNGVRYSYTDPATGILLRLDFSEPNGSAVGNWQSYSKDFALSHPGYQGIHIGSVSCPNGATDCADWEFTFPQNGAVRHVIDRAVVCDNIAFAVYISAPTNLFPQAKPVFDYVVEHITIG